jgi:hypothetical protein
VLAADFAAFPGCWQVVMHLITPLESKQQQQQELSTEQQLQRALLAAGQAVAADWPACGGLMSMHLQQQQQQQQQQDMQVHSFPVAAGSSALQEQLVAAAELEAAAAAAAVPVGHAAAGILDSLPHMTGLQAAAAGIYLQPVVLSGSSSSNSIGHGAGSAAELCITQAAVQLLQAAGRCSARVVVTSADRYLPVGSTDRDGEVTLDETMQLAGMSRHAADAAQLSLPLQLRTGDHPQVLSVTVLSNSAADHHVVAPAAAAAGTPAASHEHAVVLAKLPLLLLPAGATAELQQLAAGMVDEGMQPAAAYQELLPLLQDLAAVLCSAQHGSASSQQQHQQQQQLQQAMQDALAECFAAYDMAACQQLLQTAASDATVDAAAGRARAAAATAAAAAVPALVQRYDAASEPAGAAPTAKLKLAERCNATSSSSSSSSDISDVSSSSSSSSSSVQPVCYDSIGAALSQKHLAAAAALPGGRNTCRVTLWSVLFGFPAAATDAFASFRCSQTGKSDFLYMLAFGIGLVPTIGKVVLLLARGGSSSSQLLAACFRVLFLATQFVARAAVWAAGMWPQRFGFLQRWRTFLLLGAISLMLHIPVAAVVVGGEWRAAGFAAVSGYHSLPWLMLAYRHVVEPLGMNAGVLPALFLLAECVLLLDPVFGPPQLLAGSPVPAAVLMAGVHLSVAAKLEYSMQHKFARHVASSRRRCC